MNSLSTALADKLWADHKLGDSYSMTGAKGVWKIAYYPIFEDGKTGKRYDESRALVEQSIPNGTDFREVPLRYLTKINTGEDAGVVSEYLSRMALRGKVTGRRCLAC
jgi:hypothetical protein